MTLTNLARICALVLGSLAAGKALALPKLQIRPVELMGYVGKAVKLSVDLPCGGEYYGLVASADKKGRLKVAAAVVQDSIVCTSTSEPIEVLVDYLAITRFKTIEPMIVDEGNPRLLVARISDLRLVQAGEDSNLAAVYEPRCGRDMGTLIRKVGKGRLEIAFVESPAGMPSVDGCESRQKKRVITALDTAASFKVAALKDKPKSLSRAFRLKLAPLVPNGVRAAPGTPGLSVSYQRKCNEAPVGIVLGAPLRGQDGKPSVRVGVLVAEYYNFPCAATHTGKDGGIATLSDRDLTLPVGARVLAMKAKGELTVLQPTKIRHTNGNGVVISANASCREQAEAIYTRDARGALTVGVLSGAVETELGGAPCKDGSAELSLSQPYVASRVKAGQLFGMRLKR